MSTPTGSDPVEGPQTSVEAGTTLATYSEYHLPGYSSGVFSCRERQALLGLCQQGVERSTPDISIGQLPRDEPPPRKGRAILAEAKGTVAHLSSSTALFSIIVLT